MSLCHLSSNRPARRIFLWRSALLAALFLCAARFASSMYVSEIQRAVLDSDEQLTAWVQEVADDRGRKLCAEVTPDPTLLVRSSGDYGCPLELYTWCFDHIVTLAELGNHMGDSYTVADEDGVYRGDDGEGLMVDFFETYRDSSTVIFAGNGTLKVLGIGSAGSFVNVLEYESINARTIATRSTIYVRVDNGFMRFIARVVFAVSDLEETVKEKLFKLDGTVVKVLKQLLDDPELPTVLAAPPTPEEEAAKATLAARHYTLNNKGEDEENEPKARGGRNGRRRGGNEDETSLPKHGQPHGEGPLILSTIETAGYWRDNLAPAGYGKLIQILGTWYGGAPELAAHPEPPPLPATGSNDLGASERR